MHISFLMGTYPSHGGVEKVSTHLANEFVKRGHKVSIISFIQPNPEIAELELDCRVNLIALKYPVNNAENIKRLNNYYRTEGLDILINQWAVPAKVAFFCKLVISGTDAKLVTVHHNNPTTNARIKDIEDSLYNKSGLFLINKLKYCLIKLVSRINLRIVYELSDSYVVLSESFKPMAKHYMLLRNIDKMHAITNPLTIAAAPDSITKKNKILFVGRIENKQKRTLRLLDIWNKIANDMNDWEFIIVGDGPDRILFEKEIKRRELDRIYVQGFCSPEPYMTEAKILLLVSDFEGLPLVLAEAMSYGVVPIVLNSFTSSEDIIVNGTNGYLLDMPFCPGAFAEKITELAIDVKKLTEMGDKARQQSRNFKIDYVVSLWETLFKNLRNESV